MSCFALLRYAVQVFMYSNRAPLAPVCTLTVYSSNVVPNESTCSDTVSELTVELTVQTV